MLLASCIIEFAYQGLSTCTTMEYVTVQKTDSVYGSWTVSMCAYLQGHASAKFLEGMLDKAKDSAEWCLDSQVCAPNSETSLFCAG
jgi:hypothetical protein